MFTESRDERTDGEDSGTWLTIEPPNFDWSKCWRWVLRERTRNRTMIKALKHYYASVPHGSWLSVLSSSACFSSVGAFYWCSHEQWYLYLYCTAKVSRASTRASGAYSPSLKIQRPRVTKHSVDRKTGSEQVQRNRTVYTYSRFIYLFIIFILIALHFMNIFIRLN